MILSSGFYLGYLKDLQEKIEAKSGLKLKLILEDLSSFSCKEIISPQRENHQKPSLIELKFIAVYNNLISRGLPTLPSLLIERSLTKLLEPEIKIIEDTDGMIRFRSSKLKPVIESNWLDLLGKVYYLIALCLEAESVVTNEDKYIKLVQKIYSDPLWRNRLGIKALQLVLTPFAIARMQRVILLALESSVLSLSASEWKIMVIERNFPFAQLAVLDLLQHFEHLYLLKGIKPELPSVNLLVYNPKKFACTDCNLPSAGLKVYRIQSKRKLLDEENYDDFKADLGIDLSILPQKGLAVAERYLIKSHLNFEGAAYSICSLHAKKGKRTVYPHTPIKYAMGEEKKVILKYFLQNIFRKKDFWEGQYEILARALELKDVIGLLPTGGGKSLCYQLSSLLQPGVSFIVEPLKSLMFDQRDNLVRYGIDKVKYISSNQDSEEREQGINELGRGEYQIVYISPERFQIKTFREKIKQLTTIFPVPYLVIDEAHCVSEWGHDFRISYLNLVKTVKRLCRYKDYLPVIMALTGTASYSVLTDLQREIGINDEKARIIPSTFNRPELRFQICKVPSKKKGNRLLAILKDLPAQLGVSGRNFFRPKGQATQSGLIFVPHANNKYGVYALSQFIKQRLGIDVRYYSGKMPKKAGYDQKSYETYKQRVQKTYKDNEFPLLVATKSFGMGIDKPNISYTIHYGPPQSLEAFYQEAGRAGRNRKKSICTIIFSDDNPHHADKLLDPKISADQINEKKEPSWDKRSDVDRIMYFHREAFRGKNSETKKSLKFLEKYIYPVLDRLNIGQVQEISIKYKKDKNSLEKVIYRLSLIGIVTDYTIDFKRNLFELLITKQSYEEYLQTLQDYIDRYKTREFVALVPRRVAGFNANRKLEKLVKYLIDFIYNEIEGKRRHAIRTMIDVCRISNTDQEIREAILAYLEKSPVTEPLQGIVKTINAPEWWAILQLVDDLDSARNLLYGCRRALESYPDHPGLYFLSILARLFLPELQLNSLYSDLRTALLKLKDQLSGQVVRQEGIALQFLQEFEKKFTSLEDFMGIRTNFCEIILEEISTRNMALKLYDYSPAQAENMILNLLVKRVQEFNERFLEGI